MPVVRHAQAYLIFFLNHRDDLWCILQLYWKDLTILGHDDFSLRARTNVQTFSSL